MIVNRRLSLVEADPGYCPFAGVDIKVYLKHAPDAEVYFETVDPIKREGVVFVFTADGEKVRVGGDILRATIKDVDIVIETTEENAAAIEHWFATE